MPKQQTAELQMSQLLVKEDPTLNSFEIQITHLMNCCESQIIII